jgi:hypothetical protein
MESLPQTNYSKIEICCTHILRWQLITGTFTSTTTMRTLDLALYTPLKKQLYNMSAIAEIFEKQNHVFTHIAFL